MMFTVVDKPPWYQRRFSVGYAGPRVLNECPHRIHLLSGIWLATANPRRPHVGQPPWPAWYPHITAAGMSIGRRLVEKTFNFGGVLPSAYKLPAMFEMCLQYVYTPNGNRLRTEIGMPRSPFAVSQMCRQPSTAVSNCSILARNVRRYHQIWEDERK